MLRWYHPGIGKAIYLTALYAFNRKWLSSFLTAIFSSGLPPQITPCAWLLSRLKSGPFDGFAELTAGKLRIKCPGHWAFTSVIKKAARFIWRPYILISQAIKKPSLVWSYFSAASFSNLISGYAANKRRASTISHGTMIRSSFVRPIRPTFSNRRTSVCTFL